MLKHKTTNTLTCDICKNKETFEGFDYGYIRLVNTKTKDICTKCSSKISNFVKTIPKIKK